MLLNLGGNKMKYNNMPRTELIAELEAWDNVTHYRIVEQKKKNPFRVFYIRIYYINDRECE